MRKKEKKLKYESVERVSRWNLCQYLASILYRSNKSNKDLIKIIEKSTGIGLSTTY
jgi:hypothetical protein